MEHINISSVTIPYSKYHVDFLNFVAKYHIKAPSIHSVQGQAVALLTHPKHRGKYATREDLDAFFKRIKMKTKDSIQSINKVEQWGLKKSPIRGKYMIPYPFEYYSLHVKKRLNVHIQGDKNEKINTIKLFVQTNYIDIPNDKWQIGHKDPFNPSNTSSNLVYQPPIQARYRDR